MTSKYIKSNLILFIISYLLIILIFSFTSYKFFISDFHKLEKNQNQNNIHTILAGMNSTMDGIVKLITDYSKWDDTYDFIINPNDDYIYENFREGTTTLLDLGLDFIMFSNLKQKTIYSKYPHDILEKDKKDLEREIYKRFNKNTNANTVFKFKTYSLYIIKSEIQKSDRTGKTNGYIYTGKIINNKNLNAITNIFKKMYLSDKHSLGSNLEINLSYFKNIKVKTTSTNSIITNNIQIYDSKNNYVFSIITQNKRDIVNHGQETIAIFNVIISIFLFIILYILYRNKNILEQKIEAKSNELIEKQKIMAHQSKMAAMGEMIENIAHQWRQPLSVISTASSGVMLHKELNILSDEILLESMNNINNSTQYLSQTIDDFKNFFKQDKEKVLFDVTPTVEKAIDLIHPILADKKIKVIKNMQDVKFFGIDNELIQVLLNAVNNVIDAFEINESQNDKLIFIDTFKKDDNIVINIKDNAGGINEDILERVFEPYFTTKHQSQGTGIGLYMSMEIITKHLKGEIVLKNTSFTFNSVNYKGAVVTIKLPMYEQSPLKRL